MFKFLKRKNKQDETDSTAPQSCQNRRPEYELTTENLKKILGRNMDVQFKEVYINGNHDLAVTLLFVDGLVDSKVISDDLLKPLFQNARLGETKNLEKLVDLIEHGTVYYPTQRTRTNINDVVSDVLNAGVALVFDGTQKAITFGIGGFEKRNITEPSDENVIKGAKDSFVETLRVNTATVRRKIRTPDLIIEETIVGKQTLTPVAIVYIEGTANRHIVDEVRKRLDSIDIAGAISLGFIEELIVDDLSTPFPQVVYTERPDKFCENIIEGRVGIIIDGIPLALIVPGTIVQFMQAPEDYARNYMISSIVRMLRYLFMLVSLVLPAFYVALTAFHQEMLPTDLAISIQASKEGVPFPIFVETIIILIAFEALQEAALHLPITIAQSVSIVGALVVGDAAVNAKLVSPGVLVVTATAVIAGYNMPNQDFSNALRLWRLILVILSSIAGLPAIAIGLIFLTYQLCRMESFGIPYFSPLAGHKDNAAQDTVIRLPLKYHKKRPKSLKVKNKNRKD